MIDSPTETGEAIYQIIKDTPQLAQIAFNGQLRMGKAGAAKRIAECLQKTLLKY